MLTIVASLNSSERVSISQKDLKSSVNFVRRAGPPDLNASTGMASGPGAFPHDICLIALATSSSEGGMSRSGLIAAWGRHSIAASFKDDGWLRTPSKCSAHLSTILFLSMISFFSSALGMVELPDAGGSYMVLRESKKRFISCLLA